MSRLLLFAGTTEGRELAEYLERQKVPCDVCVATEYGQTLLSPEHTIHQVHAGRLDETQMLSLIREREITHIVDATHPYAKVVSENIERAAAAGGCRYYRLLRAASAQNENTEDLFFDTLEEAISYLATTQGSIFAATGSKELAKYTALPDYEQRVYARILSTKESMDIAAALGWQGSHLICMQGPFSQELNTAMLKQTHAAFLVTKESGKTGGFPEKQRAAHAAGARLVVIGRPPQAAGYSPLQIRRILQQELSFSPERRISIVGIGMGTPDGLTRRAWHACERAELLIGASRMLEAVRQLGKPELQEYRADEICAYLNEHSEYERIAILMSGDVGFYSGAEKLIARLKDKNMEVLPGISSVVALAASLGISWEDAKLVSVHGRGQNIVAAVREHKKVFSLVGKEGNVHQLCDMLIAYGLSDVKLSIGVKLSYPDETILTGSPGELNDAAIGDLSAVFIENPHAEHLTTHGLPDEAFRRGKVPMTKSEVRSVSLSRLRLHADSIIYDVGAGTGSVSIEMARCAEDGMVYAIERKAEAVELIRENQFRFGVSNLQVIEGLAPQALEALPAPTHAFIGGSAGSMEEILRLLLAKNPQVRIVINAIALETVGEVTRLLKELPVCDVEITSVTAARSHEVGGYHMMMGQNPVYIISFQGKKAEETGL